MVCATLLYHISISCSLALTALLTLLWLLDTSCSRPTICCCTIIAIVGYPTLLTTVKLKVLDDLAVASSSLWMLLPTGIPLSVMAISLCLLGLRKDDLGSTREVSRAGLARLPQLALVTYFVFILIYLKKPTEMSSQLYLFLYYTGTRTLPLVNTLKLLPLLVEEREFASQLKNRIRAGWLRGCLCDEGVYLY